MNLADLKIPGRYESALAWIVECAEDQLEKVFSALNEASPTVSVPALASQVAADAGVSAQELEEVFRAVAGLYLLFETPEANREEVVNGLCEYLPQTEDRRLHLAGEGLKTFRERLGRLLAFETVLGTMAKGLDVRQQHQRWLCVPRAFTDLRPVFPFNSEDEPWAFVVVHTLRLRYHEGLSRETKDFYIALDSGGLERLLEVLERAKRKEIRLRLASKGAHPPILEDSGECD